MKETTCAVLAVLLAAPVVGAQAIEAPNEWDAAILEIEDKRCIGKLCLGMTLAEAEALFGPALAGTDQVLGRRQARASCAIRSGSRLMSIEKSSVLKNVVLPTPGSRLISFSM